MATFLHRLCLFALMATTGFALSNCRARMQEDTSVTEAEHGDMVQERSGHTADHSMDGGRMHGGMSHGDMMDGGMGMDGGMRMDSGGRMGAMDAGTGMGGMRQDAGTRR